MIQTAPEIHMWMGLRPPLYIKLRTIPFVGQRIIMTPDFKSANDETFGEVK